MSEVPLYTVHAADREEPVRSEEAGLLIRKHNHYTPARKMRGLEQPVTNRFYPMERLSLSENFIRMLS